MKKVDLLFSLFFFFGFCCQAQEPDSIPKCGVLFSSQLYRYMNQVTHGNKYQLYFELYHAVGEPFDSSGVIEFQDGINVYGIIGDSIIYEKNGKTSLQLKPPKLLPYPNLKLPHIQGHGRALERFEIKNTALNLYFSNLSICRFTMAGFDSGRVGEVPALYFEDCALNGLDFRYVTVKRFELSNCRTGVVRFNICVLDDITISGDCKFIDFSKSKLLKNPKISLNTSPQVIKFENCDLTNLQGFIDLNYIFKDKLPSKTKLYLAGTDISKFRFNYNDFTLGIEKMSYEDVQTLYKDLKDQYNKLGMTENYRLTDIDEKKLEYNKGGWFDFLTGKFNWWWWHFGYDKSLILKNSAILFLLFFSLNLVIGLPRLLSKGYPMKDFPVNATFWRNLIYTFLYTAFIFWGINLDKKQLNIKHLNYVFYILTQYLVGIICLAYLAGFILSK